MHMFSLLDCLIRLFGMFESAPGLLLLWWWTERRHSWVYKSSTRVLDVDT